MMIYRAIWTIVVGTDSPPAWQRNVDDYYQHLVNFVDHRVPLPDNMIIIGHPSVAQVRTHGLN